jgi:hypothetical protein
VAGRTARFAWSDFGGRTPPNLPITCLTPVVCLHVQIHDGRSRSCIVPFLDSHPDLCSLLDDPRIEGLATGLLGDGFNLMGSDGNYYAGDTHWHSDGGHKIGDPVHIKIALYLDTLAANSGALRVIPGEPSLLAYNICILCKAPHSCLLLLCMDDQMRCTLTPRESQAG